MPWQALCWELGLDVYSLAEVKAWPPHDVLVVPLMRASTAERVRQDLAKAGADMGKIRLPNEGDATSSEAWQAFGMEDEGWPAGLPYRS